MSKDNLGDRMKGHERAETSAHFDKSLPLYCRIDGRGFSKFTKGMSRPFDVRMSNAMIETTRALVEKTNASIGFCQSDEISLIYNVDSENGSFMFDGKKQKLVSVLAGLATAAFMRAILRTEGFDQYVDRLPHFDARIFSLPSRAEAANALLWRELDATKNAISMAAHAQFSHNSMHKKTGEEKIAMLAEAGIAFDDYPAFFRHGTFLRRILEARVLTPEERLAIPESKRPKPNHTFIRSKIVEMEMPSFRTVINREGVIFDGETPCVV